MNTNDADRIRTILLRSGGVEAETAETADIVFFVTCSIRQHAEDRVFGFVHNYAEQGKKIAITGCMVRKTSSQSSEQRDSLLVRSQHIDFVFRIEDSPQLPEILREFFPLLEKTDAEFPGIFETFPTQRQSYSAFVPISTGCDHHCTYCIVPHTRGKEVCRSREEIIEECRELIRQGAKEITLLGQNVNRYYFGERRVNPYRTDFAELLEEVARLPHLKWLRFVSPHPQHLGEDVLDVMRDNPTICRHLHLPVQSGNNAMLARMARGYTAEKFSKTLALAREKMPDISLTTDIIVGFCEETEEEFEDSRRLCEKEKFDKIFIGKFSVRPNTPAEKWKDTVPQLLKKQRFHEINMVLKKTAKANNQKDIGQIFEVLVDGVDENNIAKGHTSQNKIVEFPVGERGERCVGEFFSVKITSAQTFLLQGEVQVV